MKNVTKKHRFLSLEETALKITNIKATPINIPMEIPYWWTGGLYPGTSKVIIEVETDESIVGLGEAPSVDVLDTINLIGKKLIGMDPIDIAACKCKKNMALPTYLTLDVL